MRRLIVVLAGLMLASCMARAQKTVDERVREFGPGADGRWKPLFARAGIPYPPAEAGLLGFKEERRLEVFARRAGGAFRFLRAYPILAASGGPGPKLREGDLQVPEGTYRVAALNPNSRFHLSLRLDYPNAFDREHARRDGRTFPGTDIMIHGGAVSVGCLAMGDEAAEDLFVLAARAGIRNIAVILSPVDFRDRSLETLPDGVPEWTSDLYRGIREALAAFPRAE